MLRSRFFLPTLVLAAFSSGCALFRPRPIEAPDAVLSRPGLAQLRAGEITREALDRAFPPIDRFILSSRAIAARRRFFGKIYIDMSMIAAGKDAVRMLGKHPGDGTPLFELVTVGRELKVYVPPAKSYFEGMIPPEGSPFNVRFSVEPWDLIPIIAIGRRLAEGDFTASEGRWARTLTPTATGGSSDGLTSVELENATGLPRRATWRRGKLRWEVEYLAWDLFAGYGEAERLSWLMPTHFIITRISPRATVEVMKHPTVTTPQYRIDPPLNRAFELSVPVGTARGTLEDLDRVLTGK